MRAGKKVIYSGRVQGVGFRMTARRVAERFQVAGTVRNLANGNVELVAEGEAAEIERFLEAVSESMEGYIDGQDVRDLEPQALTTFEIRH